MALGKFINNPGKTYWELQNQIRCSQLSDHYAYDRSTHFRASNLSVILITTVILLIPTVILECVAIGNSSHNTATRILLPCALLTLLISGFCYWCVQSGKLEVSQKVFFSLSVISIFGALWITGGLETSPVAPALVIPTIIAFCIFGKPTNQIVAILTPLAILVFTGLPDSIMQPPQDFDHTESNIHHGFLIGLFTYVFTVLALFTYDKAYDRILNETELQVHEIHKISSRDYLTGVYSRRELLQVLQKDAAENFYNAEIILTTILDINTFKSINDRYGHLVGDTILASIGKSLQGLARQNFMSARLGGDEFAVIYKSETVKGAHLALKEIETVLPKTLTANGNIIPISFSIGASIHTPSEYQMYQAFKEADYALYVAKTRPNFASHIFSLQDQEKIAQTQENTERVRHYIETNTIQSQYQLIKRRQAGPSAVESLLRLQGKNGQFLCPCECMSAIADLGLVSRFTRIQLKSNILDLMAVSGTHLLAYNLSPEQLDDPKLLTILDSVLKTTGFAPKRLVLEISELTAQKKLDRNIKTFKKIKKMGIKIAIDDFGAGNTGFHIFRTLPVDIIKADKSLLSQIDNIELNTLILRQIHELGSQFNIETVCEGVEDLNYMQSTNLQGYDYLQGYAISKPGNLIDQLIKDKEIEPLWKEALPLKTPLRARAENKSTTRRTL